MDDITRPIDRLLSIMARLRDPQDGCPWDLEQDHQSLARHLREEAAEALDALAAHVPGDPEKERHLREELGDLLLQVAFHEAEPAPWPLEGPDPDDLVFLALAKATGAVLVTGNLGHFPEAIREGVAVCTPGEYFRQCPPKG